jgi:hypothetical protein
MAKLKKGNGVEPLTTYVEVTRKVDRAGSEVDPAKPLSGTIRRYLAGTGLSSYQIAAKVGMTPPAMHRFLTGERGLSLEMLDRLIVAMNLEVVLRSKSGD